MESISKPADWQHIIWQQYKLVNIVYWYLEFKIQWTKAKTLVG